MKVFHCYGNKSTILLFNSIFRTAPEVSAKLYFVEISYTCTCKFQASFDFLITKEQIFWLPAFGLLKNFSASLICSAHAIS